MKTIAITIENAVLHRIDKVASNRSEFIRKAVDEYLEEIERIGEETREREILRRNRDKLHRQAIALIKDQARQ